MGDKITLKLDERTVHGKKVRALRRQGIVPGVVYGPETEPIAVQADAVLIGKMYAAAGKHAPVHLTIGTSKKIAMIKDVEISPVKNSITHVSFHAVKANEPVEAEVPIRLIGEGESDAEKAGYIILQNIDSLEVKALPMDLPDALELDITGLKEAGERLTVADVKIPANVELVEHETGHEEEGEEHSITELQVVSVWEPSALAAQNDAAGGDATDESEVEAENGGDAAQDSPSEESSTGGKGQDESK